MNKINPLYLLGAFTFLLLLLGIQSIRMEDRAAELARENVALVAQAKRIDALKKRWKDPKTAKAQFERILNLRKLAAATTLREKRKGNVYHVELSALNAVDLDLFTAKVMTGAFKIKSVAMTRNADKNVSTVMEIDL